VYTLPLSRRTPGNASLDGMIEQQRGSNSGCQAGDANRLTSIGSGTVVRVRPPATILTVLEAVFGQFYITVVAAQLVSGRLSHAARVAVAWR
jgi:hypothetical protein